jgi:hypothetical protein
MTPFQSARTKQLHKFFHHVRNIRKEIQLASSLYPTPNQVKGCSLDQRDAESHPGFWQDF